MIDLKHGNLGFMKDASYTAHFHLILQKYDGLFNGSEKVTVEIEETPYYALQLKRSPWLVVSDDRKEITIKLSVQKYYDNKGNVTHIPSAHDVHMDLHSLMKRAVESYNENDKK